MRAIISMFIMLSTALTLQAEIIRCTTTKTAEAVFSMDTQNMQGQITRAGTTRKMACRDDGNKSWRCFAQSERDSFLTFEVIVSQSSRFIEYYGRDFWAYPLTCEVLVQAPHSRI